MSEYLRYLFKGAGDAVELERVMGIEPTLSAWEAEVLPLNYTRVLRYKAGSE